jgi:hypothetical protein
MRGFPTMQCNTSHWIRGGGGCGRGRVRIGPGIRVRARSRRESGPKRPVLDASAPPRWWHGHGHGHRSPIRAGGSAAWGCGSGHARGVADAGRGSWTQASGRAWASSSSVPRKARRATSGQRLGEPLGEPLIGPFQQLNHPAACVEERSEFRRPSNLLLV